MNYENGFEYHEDIIGMINSLRESKVKNKQALLDQMSVPIRTSGLNRNELYEMLDIIFDLANPKLTFSQISFVVKQLLIPNGTYRLPKDIIYRILSSIGIPQAYYRNGTKLMLKKLSTRIQLQLLEWLVCTIHLFGENALNKTQMLSLLVQYLPYEFLRPYIANLIFLSLLGNKRADKMYYNKSKLPANSFFKKWQVQYVVDLHCKFPIDEHLKGLLILFKMLQPNIDYKSFSRDHGDAMNNLFTIDTNIFIYPNFNFLDKLKEIQAYTDGSLQDMLEEQDKVLRENLKRYNSFNVSFKRRKVARQKRKTLYSDFDVMSWSDNNSVDDIVSINNIHSNKELINNFGHIKFINVQALFSPTADTNYISTKFKKMFLTLKFLEQESPRDLDHLDSFIRKLDYFIRLSILDNNFTEQDFLFLCDKIDDFLTHTPSNLFLNSIEEYVCSGIRAACLGCNKQEEYTDLLEKLKFLKHFPIPKKPKLMKLTLLGLVEKIKVSPDNLMIEKKRRLNAFITLTKVVIILFNNWSYEIKKRPENELRISETFEIINAVITSLFGLAVTFRLLPSKVQLLLTKVLGFIAGLDTQLVTRYIEARTLVLSPTIFYQLLFSKSPLIHSELCGYITFCKSVEFKKENEYFKRLHNVYTMDILNFLWREKSFLITKNRDDFNNGMLLSANFVDSLEKLNVFNFSDLMCLQTVGNFFNNPAWSYITAEIIRIFEDNTADITTRHAGPITKESVSKLAFNPNVQWLPYSYEELKIQIILQLDKYGYKGLADLLFSSLKPLMNRQRKYSGI